MNNDWREYTGDPDYLAHFGTKGMHWGVRKYETASGKLTPAGQARYNTVNGKYQKVKAAKAAKRSALGEYNKDFAKAYNASQRLNISKKRKADRDAKLEKAYESGKKADKAVNEYKKAKIDYKMSKKIAKNETERDKILEARAKNREKIANKKTLLEKNSEIAAKVYDKLGNKTLASIHRANATKIHNENAAKRNERLKNFDAGTKAVKSGYDRYSNTLKNYSKSKISAVGNRDARKADSYKSAKKAYIKQVGSDLLYGKVGTKLNYASDAYAQKKKKR